MKKTHDLITEAKELLEGCSDSSLSSIDLDSIVNWIRQAREELNSAATAAAELTILRTHLTDRIAGMAKAIAAVGRGVADLREVDEFIEKLCGMDAGELIRAYHRLSARFRDTFPTSFGRMKTHRIAHQKQRHEIDY